MTIKVLLADDHTIVRDGLCALLEKHGNINVVGSVSNGREAVKLSHELNPDVVLMDISMPELNGIDATEQIRADSPATQVVILSIHATSEHIYRAFRAGALGYLLKESAGSEAVLAIQSAYEKRRYLTQRIADTVLDNYLIQRAVTLQRSPLETLSKREREVLQLTVEGKSAEEIADVLALSAKSVETYRTRLKKKLGVNDLPALVMFAIQHGITPLR
jgi:DNA-binding NarL/FixJ family response regulator